jgi:hypothetical protein
MCCVYKDKFEVGVIWVWALSCVAICSGQSATHVLFHVLYNVRKRTRHIGQKERILVLRGIMDMHY